MAGSSRSTPFPVPVYIYRSFIDPKFTGTSTGTGTGTQGFEVSLSWSWSDLIHGTIVPLVLRSNIDILADLSWLLCMICHAWILRLRIRVWTRRIRLVRKSEFSDRMHEDRLAGFDQPPSTERANKPWIGFLPALHYPSIYWWHYVMVSIIQPWTWDRGLLWLTLSFFIYITAKPVGYIYPKEISINTVKFLYQTIVHLDSSGMNVFDNGAWAPHTWDRGSFSLTYMF